jgi:hypothetical protein
MPFSGQIYFFNQWVIATANEVGAVYGLFKPSLRAGYVDCLYVGKTDNLRRRLAEHLNNPPVAGITHWFAEVHATELQRTLREAQLIAEFQPPGNTVGRR